MTHGVFSQGALERIGRSPIRELVITDTVSHQDAPLPANVTELSVAGLLGDAVQRIHEERSLSSLFICIDLPSAPVITSDDCIA